MTGDVTATAGNVTAGADVSAVGGVTGGTGVVATTGDVAATAGNVTAGANVSAVGGVTGGTGVTATTGNVAATVGNVSAGIDVSAGGNVTAGVDVSAAGGVTGGTGVTAITGDVSATAGNVTAGVDVSAAGGVTGGTGVTATTGDVSATAGNVTAGADVSAAGGVTGGTGVTATTGDVSATAGNVTAGVDVTAAGGVTGGTGVTATNGDVSATVGNVTAGADVVAGTDIISTTGDISALSGAVSASGNISAGAFVIGEAGVRANNGDVVASNGNISATLGDIDAVAGRVTAALDVTAGAGLNATTGDVIALAGNIVADQDVTATNGNVNAGNSVFATNIVDAGVSVSAGNTQVMLDADVNGDGRVEVFSNSTGIPPALAVVTMGQDPDTDATSITPAEDGLLTVLSTTTGTPILLDGSTSTISAITANATVKAFVQPHPTDPSLQIVYHCLEGPENGLYARGRTRLNGGRADLQLPDSFTLAASNEGLSVVLTPMDECNGLFVPSDTLNRSGFSVRELMSGNSDAEFSWIVYGVRRGLETHQAIQPNTFYRPRVAGVPFMKELPGVQQLLINSGILKADGTPDLSTAEMLGWQLYTPLDRELKERTRQETIRRARDR